MNTRASLSIRSVKQMFLLIPTPTVRRSTLHFLTAKFEHVRNNLEVYHSQVMRFVKVRVLATHLSLFANKKKIHDQDKCIFIPLITALERYTLNSCLKGKSRRTDCSVRLMLRYF